MSTNLDKNSLEALRHSVRTEMEDRAKQRPANWFPSHDQQNLFLDMPREIRARGKSLRVLEAIGGNRGGKSKAGLLLLSQIIRREHPLFYQFTKMDPFTGNRVFLEKDDPITVWVVPPTDEKLKHDIWAPSDGMGLPYFIGEDLIANDSRSPGNYLLETTYGDTILGKSQKQDIMTFESSGVHIIWWDEEPEDEQKFNSGLLRLGTTNGFTMLTFTPLRGLSWSYDRFYKPLVKHGRAEVWAPRAWIHTPDQGRSVAIVQMGTRDNPLAREYADEVEADPEMSDSEKRSRLYGEYGYVEGALLPKLSGMDLEKPTGYQELYVVDKYPGQIYRKGAERKVVPGNIYEWMMVADPNKSFGAILCGKDGDGNLFFFAEHLVEGWADVQHVAALQGIEKEFSVPSTIGRYADPGGAGAHSRVNMAYHGMIFKNVTKGAGSVSESIKKLRGLTYIDPKHKHPLTGKKGAPRCYFYRPGLLSTELVEGRVHRKSKLVEQLSLARQSDNPRDPPDTPHKDVKNKLDLFDCARYAARTAAGLDVTDAGRTHKRHEAHSYRTRNLPTDKTMKPDNPNKNPMDFDMPVYDIPS